MKYIDVLMAISQETNPDHLRVMIAGINDRLSSLALIRGSTIKVGDTVKFADIIQPTYLRGLPAKVVGVNRKSVSVSCPKDTRYGRFSGSNKVRLPLTLVAMQ